MNLNALIETGNLNPFFLFFVALLLGGLHGLEPGHSKTMMAAYIIAIKGKVRDAIVLGISAAISHSIIVWVLAFFALVFGNELIGEQLEPWFILFSGFLIIGIAFSIFWTQFKTTKHPHDHHSHHHSENEQPDYSVVKNSSYVDKHALSHAKDIEASLISEKTGVWQTIFFGFSGGLIPCPAAITVFLVCLQLNKISLGIVLVGAFSLGLATTLVLVGSIAALGINIISKRFIPFGGLLETIPYFSSILICLIGVFVIYSGYSHLIHIH